MVTIVILIGVRTAANAQSLVVEITWNAGLTYRGLMVTYPDNTGVFVVGYFHPGLQQMVKFVQSVDVRNQYDVYGNCTSFLNCYNPQSYPYIPYSADMFIVYPNGRMYTQDAAGTWSTAKADSVIQPAYWQMKFREYGL